MATNAHSQFWVVLEFLYKAQQRDWNQSNPTRKISKVARLTYRELSQTPKLNPVRVSEFKKWKESVDSPVDFQTSGSVMLLLPPEKNASFLPVMSIDYRPCDEFDESCLRIRVLLVGREGTGDETRLVGVGFRIESPEKHCQANDEQQEPGKGGMHDFYHAQLIKKIEDGPEIDAPSWLPCHQPSFPLWAANPIDAILNLVLTLYGGRYYKEFLSGLPTNSRAAISKEFKRANELFFKS